MRYQKDKTKPLEEAKLKYEQRLDPRCMASASPEARSRDDNNSERQTLGGAGAGTAGTANNIIAGTNITAGTDITGTDSTAGTNAAGPDTPGPNITPGM